MKHVLTAAFATLALAALPALASEATFERNLSVSGRVELTVSTGSGHIHLTHGSGTQVHISGRVKSSWGGATPSNGFRKSPRILPSSRPAISFASGRTTRTSTTSASTTTSRPRRRVSRGQFGLRRCDRRGCGRECEALHRVGLTSMPRASRAASRWTPARATSMRSKPARAT